LRGRERTSWWTLIAGVAAGYAWCVRNVAAALVLASLVYLVTQGIRIGWRRTVAMICVWSGGWLLGGGWLVAWNLRTFGEVNPYHMPLRELSVLLVAAIAAVALAGVVLAGLLWRRKLMDLANDRPDICLLGSALLFHVLVIVLAQGLYRMGESISSFRFYAPVYWIVLWLLALGVIRLRAQLSLSLPTVWTSAVAATVVFLAMAAPPTLRHFGRQIVPPTVKPPTVNLKKPDRDEATRLGKEIPKDMLVLTDCVEELRVFGGINARHVPDRKYGQVPVTWGDIKRSGGGGHLWGIIVWDEAIFRGGGYGNALQELVVDPDKYPCLRRIETRGRMHIWKFVP
jgi:hypothetical protein